MADIKYSTDCFRNYILTLGTIKTSVSDGVTGYNSSSMDLRIYKNTIPVKGDINTTAASIFRTSDLLITFDFPGGTKFNLAASGPEIVQANSPIAKVASATGTAEWFAMYSSTPNLAGQILVGSITAVGGGGDIQVGSTSITSGGTYVLNEVSFTFPLSYTYT